jgi:anti-sigma regulatory factor (Ser/Thr protein kinase)
MHKKFKRDIKSLDSIFKFINDFIERHALDHSLTFVLELVVEELFTNMVKYNSNNPKDIAIELNKKKNDLIVVLTDFDAEPFDITKRPEIDVDQLLEERKVGGLGIHLVKQMMDKIDYQYKNRVSKITLTKHLEN